MHMKTKYLSLLFLTVFLLAGCDRTDDITGIFTGKTWKLTKVGEGSSGQVNYWGEGVNASEKYVELLQGNNNHFTLAFDGLEIDGVITGTYRGLAINEPLSGTWQGDADNRNFSTNQAEVEDGSGEVLANVFIKALSTAYKYEGDYNKLRLYFKEDNKERYLLMRVYESQ